MTFKEKLNQFLAEHESLHIDPPRRNLIRLAVERREAVALDRGALATWTPKDSTGRSPSNTYLVKRKENEMEVDWDFPGNHPLAPETFELLLADAVEALATASDVFITNRTLGADPAWAMPVRTITTRALTALFTDNMFRPLSEAIEQSIFNDRPFNVLVVPFRKLDPERYRGQLRIDPATGQTSNMVIATDLERRLGVVYGSAYNGSVKKQLFTAMNFYLPQEGIFPLHCSANEGARGDTALFLGLSGTGKTTLSADPERLLLGDDEHGWGENGIANFEGGCYAKLIDLDLQREPEIHQAVFHRAGYLEHGAVIENTMIYPDGSFDLTDDRLTANSRASYPLEYLQYVKDPPTGTHPETIIFLTADANGVLPPISRLTKAQARFWFLMGYTSKIPGTETGVTEPKTTFSRFFGAPFMPRLPRVYAEMLGKKMEQHDVQVFLLNTGWTGGPFGKGKRMELGLTRTIVKAALAGQLRDVAYQSDPIFKVQIPQACPGLDDFSILDPVNRWEDKQAFYARAGKLANEFARHFMDVYGDGKIGQDVAGECPGM